MAALQRVIDFLPFLLVATCEILPAPGTLTFVVKMIDDLVTLALALVTVNRLEGGGGGGVGGAVGVTAADAADGAEVPPALLAVAVKV